MQSDDAVESVRNGASPLAVELIILNSINKKTLDYSNCVNHLNRLATDLKSDRLDGVRSETP